MTVLAYLVSDTARGATHISAIFSGPKAKESATRWAGQSGKVTRIYSSAILSTLRVGKKLPARYN